MTGAGDVRMNFWDENEITGSRRSGWCRIHSLNASLDVFVELDGQTCSHISAQISRSALRAIAKASAALDVIDPGESL
jgi:hypothetical protein